jgi:Arc/MetJ-type ribon-helix-helix transcriptional regulator
MTTLHLSLPEPLKHFVEEQTAKGGFRSESDYLQSLVSEAQQREVEKQLLEGLASPASPMTPDDWADLRRQIIERSPELKES